MRESKFESLDEARKSLKEHPLAADYLLGLLVHRGVMMIMDDGTVVGGYEVVEREGPENPDKPKLGPQEWKKEWPDKAMLMAYLNCFDDKPSAKFRWVQKMLASRGQPATHWITLHAIWHLMKHGMAEKKGGGYRLTELGLNYTLGTPEIAGETPEWTKAQAAEFMAALKEMDADTIGALESMLGDTTAEDYPGPDCTAAQFTKAFNQYEGSDEWMDRPEMRGGFNLAFVRWVQAMWAEKGSLT